jgi:hypothetical protein
MTPVLVLLAVLAVAGGVVAVAAPNPRHAALGAFATALLAAFVADPLPSAEALVARTAGALLGGWLTWIALRSAPARSDRSALGWPGSAAVALVGFVAGWLAAGSLGSTLAGAAGGGQIAGLAGAALAAGSPVALAAAGAACALLVIGVAPVVLPRDGLRVGLGVIVLLSAASLLGNALGAGPDATVELAYGVLVAVTGAGIAAVTATMLHATGDLRLRDPLARDAAVRHRPADEAHRRSAQ